MKPKTITITNEFAARVAAMLSHLELVSGELDAGIASAEIRGLIAPDTEAPEPALTPKYDWEATPAIDHELEIPNSLAAA